jgi:TonB-linked SusC/RagA family outer membrane protein
MIHKSLGLGVVALLSVAVPAAAQEAVIRGMVLSDRGERMPAATVQVAELNMFVISGDNGQYSIGVPAARVRGQTVTVRVRRIGFRPRAVTLSLTPGEHTVNFTLATDVNLLDAVVVTGVAEETQAAKVPFDVGRVDVADMPVPQVNALSQIQGKLPGVSIVSHNGRPGEAPSVLLRGPRSLNAAGRSQEPLYIVDGAIINGALPELNPDDIESVEVVKGAAGASLYGARAGNGVIQISTKSGSRATEGVRFTARSEYGVSDVERDFGIARYHGMLMDETGTRFCEAVTGEPVCARTFNYAAEQARVNDTAAFFAATPKRLPVDPGTGIGQPALRQRFNATPWPGLTYNAVKQFVRPQPYVENSIDLTGRLGGTRFFASAADLDQTGAIRFLEGFRRQSYRINVDQSVGANWNVSVRSFYSRGVSDGENEDDGGTAFFRLTRVPGVVNLLQRDTLGRLYIRPNLQGGGQQNQNPLYLLENVDRRDASNRFIGGLRVQFQPAVWATFAGNLSYDLRRTEFHQINDKGFRSTTNNATVINGLIFRGSSTDEALNADFDAIVRRDFRSDLRGRASFRVLYENRLGTNQNGQGNFLAVQGVKSLNNTRSDGRIVESSQDEIEQIGVFAGAGLEYKDRYIVDGVVRRDGSSLFGSASRWATFGRGSVAWRVALEPWWPLPQVSELKLRGTYGTAGNSPRFSAQYETFEVAAGGIITLVQQGNPDLRPELNKELELGADIELFSRYGLTVTYSRNVIDRQILPVPVTAATGFQRRWENAGELTNKTWELSLNVPLIQKPDISWSMRVNYDRTRSVITRLDVPPYTYGANLQATEAIFQAREGERLGTFYGDKFARSCSDLPAPFNSSANCGGDRTAFQINDEGWLVWVGTGNSWSEGITRNLWETQLPASQGPWGVAMNFGMPIIIRGAGSDGTSITQFPLGNALPDFHFSVTQNFQWRRLTVYALVDASIGQDVWNQGFHWAHLDFLSEDVDQYGKSVETAKPFGYYWRAGAPTAAGLGGFYHILAPTNYSVEDASYAKLRELLVSYHVGPVGGIGDWEVSVIGRNLFTITGYRGFDPEVGVPGGNAAGAATAAINAIDAFTFPNLRSLTVGFATTF